MATYFENIYFAQESDAEETLEILTEFGEAAAMQYLIDFDYGESPVESIEGVPWGTCDEIYKKDNYVMSYNIGLQYIGLVKIH